MATTRAFRLELDYTELPLESVFFHSCVTHYRSEGQVCFHSWGGGGGVLLGVAVTVAVMSCDQRLLVADQSVLPPLFAEQLACFLAGRQDVV